MTWSGRKPVRLVFAIVGLAVMVFSVLPIKNAYAVGQLEPRSLTLQGVGSVGGSQPNGTVNDLFSFTTVTSASIGSIEFQYCTTAGGTCVMPTGLVTTSANITSVPPTGTGMTGFSLVNTSNGDPYLTRTASSLPAGAVTVTLAGVTNPTAANTSFYVHITTYTATTPGGGGATDSGTVGASTASQIQLTGVMPESLVFCTGATISTTGGVPDCSTATSGVISFNQVFSPTDTAIATSQMAASTNAATGYNITVNGPPLTSGSNTVTNMSTTGPSTHGISQFGMNLESNTTPTVGSPITPSSNTTNYRAQALTGYDSSNDYTYVTGQSVANSADSAAGPSDAQIYTASYIVNVNGAQPVGTYTTTLTYICTPTY
jgi:hypothetical protein